MARKGNPGAELAKMRWDQTSEKVRKAIATEIANARWEKWRAENPEKAKASEERRKKRARKTTKKR